MDGPRDDHTKRSQTETNIQYHLYVESEKQNRRASLQSSSRLTDVENTFVVAEGERG